MPKIVRNANAVECQSLLLLIMYLLDLWRSARDRHPVGPFSLIEWDLVKATITKYLLVWSTYPPDLGGVHISTWFEMIDESKPDGWRKAKIDSSSTKGLNASAAPFDRTSDWSMFKYGNIRELQIQIWQFPKGGGGGSCRWGSPAQGLQLKEKGKWNGQAGKSRQKEARKQGSKSRQGVKEEEDCQVPQIKTFPHSPPSPALLPLHLI